MKLRNGKLSVVLASIGLAATIASQGAAAGQGSVTHLKPGVTIKAVVADGLAKNTEGGLIWETSTQTSPQVAEGQRIAPAHGFRWSSVESEAQVAKVVSKDLRNGLDPISSGSLQGFRWGVRNSSEQQGFRWGVRSATEQQGFRWGVRSTADQQGFRWGVCSTADQQGFRWGVRSTADQQGFRWGVRSTTEQQGFRWGVRSSVEQQGFRWGVRSATEQQGFRWGVR